jgi:hypothetical protein
MVPAETSDLSVLSREARAYGCVGARATGEEVSEEVFDGGGFGERHGFELMLRPIEVASTGTVIR